jgi:hypothetical protein
MKKLPLLAAAFVAVVASRPVLGYPAPGNRAPGFGDSGGKGKGAKCPIEKCKGKLENGRCTKCGRTFPDAK